MHFNGQNGKKFGKRTPIIFHFKMKICLPTFSWGPQAEKVVGMLDHLLEDQCAMEMSDRQRHRVEEPKKVLVADTVKKSGRPKKVGKQRRN